MSQRWKNRPEGSNWGEFGPDDQLGRLNYITRAKVLQGVAEAREGIAFNLSLPLDYPGGSLLQPRRHPPRLKPTERNGIPYFNRPYSHDFPGVTDVVSDDAALIHLQYSTQWDSFAHVGSMFDADGDGKPEAVYYNGYRAGIDVIEPGFDKEGPQGAIKLGLENAAAHGVQGRGVLVNLATRFGRERQRVGYDTLMRILDEDRVAVEKGDMLCLYTGFADVVLEMRKKPDQHTLHNACSVLDAHDKRLLEWITASGIATLIADNYAIEDRPQQIGPGYHGPLLPLHEHCLFKNGIHLGELWHLSALARWLRENGRSRFLLTAPPLRLPGAVGAPPCPVATV